MTKSPATAKVDGTHAELLLAKIALAKAAKAYFVASKAVGRKAHEMVPSAYETVDAAYAEVAAVNIQL